MNNLDRYIYSMVFFSDDCLEGYRFSPDCFFENPPFFVDISENKMQRFKDDLEIIRDKSLIEIRKFDDGGWMTSFEDYIENVSYSTVEDTLEDALHDLRIAWEIVRKRYEGHQEPIPMVGSRKNLEMNSDDN